MEERPNMQWQDVSILAKKILVGIALTAAPLLIFLGCLKFTQRVLTSPTAQLSVPNK